MRPLSCLVVACALALLGIAPARGADATLEGVEALPGASAIAVGAVQAPDGIQDAAFATFRRGMRAPVLVRRLPRGRGPAAVLRRARRLGDRLFAVGVDGTTAVVTGIDAASGELTTDCGPRGVADLPLGFAATPSALIAAGNQLLVAGESPDGRAFAALLDASCEVTAVQRYELGTTGRTDFVLGAVLAPDGDSIYLLGREGAEGTDPDAAVLRVGADLRPLGPARLIDYGGTREGYYAGAFRGTNLVMVGSGHNRVAVRCVTADLASTTCNQTQLRFEGGNATQSQVSAGTVLAGGAPLAVGRWVPNNSEPERIGLLAATAEGAADPALDGDGRVVFGDLGRSASTVTDATASSEAIWVTGWSGAPGVRRPLLGTLGASGAAPDLLRPVLPADAPHATVAGAGAPTAPGPAPEPTEPPGPGSPGEPPAPPAAPSGGEPCACAGLTAFVNRFRRLPNNYVAFAVNWRLRCAAGPGPGCHGVIRPGVPAGKAITFSGPGDRVFAQVECGLKCGRTGKGSETVKWRGARRQLKPGRSYRFPLRVACATPRGETPRFRTLRLKLVLRRAGTVDYRRSDLDGDGGPDRGRLSFARVGSR